MAARTVLHVLPHPGAGGETYVDSLDGMEGYRFTRLSLAPSATPASRAAVVRSALRAQRSSRCHSVLHVHGEIAATLCLPTLAFRPSVVTLHGLHVLRRVSGPLRRLAEANLRAIVRAATKTICVAEAERDEVLDIVSRRAAKRLVVIHNGVEHREPPSPEERAALRAELGLPQEAVVGISVGSLDERKDPLVPVRAAVEVARGGSPLTLLVVGDGPLWDAVADASRGDGTGTVRMLGHRRDVDRLLAASDFFVLSSQREGLPYALLEAMAAGLPAIVSDYAGATEVVGDAGIVVPRGDVDAFAQALERVASDAPSRLLLGERARTRTDRLFSLDEMIARTREVYDSALEERSRR